MVVIGLADIHGDLRSIDVVGPELAKADLVLLGGDLTRFGRGGDAALVVDAVRRYCPKILAVAGNCDYPEVDAYLVAEGISLHARNGAIGGVTFLGMGGSLACIGRTPNEYSEQDLHGFLAAAAAGAHLERPTILLAHEPPFDTAVDNAHYGGHVGSKSVRAFIEANKPTVCISGHIHESRGIATLGRTQLINPGPLREGRYAYVEIDTALRVLEIRTAAKA